MLVPRTRRDYSSAVNTALLRIGYLGGNPAGGGYVMPQANRTSPVREEIAELRALCGKPARSAILP